MQVEKEHSPSRDILVLFVLVVVPRLFFLDSGFGSDVDAWRVADVGDWLRRTGDYVISRRPGYPLVELCSAVILSVETAVGWPGWRFMNLVTTVVFLSQAVVLLRLARYYRVSYPLIVVLTYSAHPTVFDQSLGSLDMHLPLLLLLLAWKESLSQRWRRAGLLWGLAIASRLTLGVTVLGFLLRCMSGDRRLRRLTGFLFPALVVALPFYVLVLGETGARIVPSVARLTSASAYMKGWILHGVFEGIGPDAAVVLLFAVAAAVRARRRAPRTQRRETRLLAATAMPTLLLFLAYPWESAYLLPAFPFLFLLLGVHLEPRHFLAFLLVWVANGFVSSPAKERNPETGRVQIGALGKGDWFRLRERRLQNVDMLHALDEIAIVPGTAIVVDDRIPVLWFHRRDMIGTDRLRFIGERITNFNNPIYDVQRDAYFVSSWPQPGLEIPPTYKRFGLDQAHRVLRDADRPE